MNANASHLIVGAVAAIVAGLGPAGAELAADNAGGGEVLTPPPAAPRFNGPRLYGARPGRPFLYRIPLTGRAPLHVEATELPSGLEFDPRTRTLCGTTPPAGEYPIRLVATNAAGRAERIFRIVSGSRLALTPPMGWNHWYTHYHRVTDAIVRRAADAMIASGMADFGYEFISIDDCWMTAPTDEDYAKLLDELRAMGVANPRLRRPVDTTRQGPARDSGGRIQPNRYFPDMKGLVDYIHERGLKAGIYTSPGPLTCGGFWASWRHEEIDAQTFAEWGFDLLKYDWCSYGKVAGGNDWPQLTAPYRQMGALLAQQPRDILFNLCQYGMGNVWTWGRDVGGHSWRTTGDVGLSHPTNDLPGFYPVALRNARLHEFGGPGGWNDPDYILIGWYGDARHERIPQRTSLTPDEQYSYISLWSLMAAPLFFSGDMERLDPFTLNVLCNSEVIAVNQDALGRQARLIRETADEWVLAKPLEDGAVAVGFFAVGPTGRTVRVEWSDLGLTGRQRVRDLWRQKDLGESAGGWAADVPRHGVALLSVTPAEPAGPPARR